jgi:hypothetical protein
LFQEKKKPAHVMRAGQRDGDKTRAFAPIFHVRCGMSMLAACPCRQVMNALCDGDQREDGSFHTMAGAGAGVVCGGVSGFARHHPGLRNEKRFCGRSAATVSRLVGIAGSPGVGAISVGSAGDAVVLASSGAW